MVLQPWITPSLFYQFEGKPQGLTAFDMHGFCAVLGAEEGNRQLREHWVKWVTEKDLSKLVEQGINTVRIPVGDWMWMPYEPYIGSAAPASPVFCPLRAQSAVSCERSAVRSSRHFRLTSSGAPLRRCTDGAIDELWRVLRLCQRVGLKALIDLHAVRYSQNGFDNSGYTRNVTWIDPDHFSHWPVRSAGWQGAFDPLTMTYASISWDNIRTTVQVLQRIAIALRNFPDVIGVEALNEPWQFTPLDVLKAFYWESYWAVRTAAPRWLFVMHDAFRLDEWAGFMRGCEGVVLDTHVYQAWFDIRPQASFLENACSWRQRIRAIQDSSMPVIVGEWSLATDNCAMWLNGFHDNAPGYPKVDCGWADCPQPYVSGVAGPPQGDDLPGPHGTGVSAPKGGKCPVSKGWENDDEYQPQAAAARFVAFEPGVGWFYMNFKAELQPQWSWQAAQRRGWLPPNVSAPIPRRLLNVCIADGGQFRGGDAQGSDVEQLPWYNALPSPHGSNSVVLLFCFGLGTLLALAALLKLVLALVSISTQRAQQGRLQLPPRLLHLARKSQQRTPGGLGPLGLKTRVSSRRVVQLTYPLMSDHYAIDEGDEEQDPQILFSPPRQNSLPGRRDLLDAAIGLLPSWAMDAVVEAVVGEPGGVDGGGDFEAAGEAVGAPAGRREGSTTASSREHTGDTGDST